MKHTFTVTAEVSRKPFITGARMRNRVWTAGSAVVTAPDALDAVLQVTRAWTAAGLDWRAPVASHSADCATPECEILPP